MRSALLWAAFVAGGCAGPAEPAWIPGRGHAPAAADADAPPDAPAPAPPARCGGSLAPLEGPGPLVALPVAPGLGRRAPSGDPKPQRSNNRTAVVSLPLGATSPRPVLVVAHGAGDRPEWQCGVWREIVKDRAFVLCVRGYPTNPYVPEEHTGYFYTDHHALGREIAMAIDALRAAFPEHADTTAPAYAGFSQGAIMGALLLPRHPARFSRAALVEGGYGFFQEWNIPVAQAFARRGGQRVLLACGGVRCVEQAEVSAFYMRRGGLDARVIHAEGAGHTYGGPMKAAVSRAFDWIVEGDPRWCGGERAEGADAR